MTFGRFYQRENGSRVRANGHISKSRYGAPELVAGGQRWTTQPQQLSRQIASGFEPDVLDEEKARG
jgi:hypothetical protein